jgi:hypothetical protein
MFVLLELLLNVSQAAVLEESMVYPMVYSRIYPIAGMEFDQIDLFEYSTILVYD